MWIYRKQVARNRYTGFPILSEETRIINTNAALIGAAVIFTIASTWRVCAWLRR